MDGYMITSVMQYVFAWPTLYFKIVGNLYCCTVHFAESLNEHTN